MTQDKQPHPTTSGHYTTSDQDYSAVWIPCYYSVRTGQWTRYNIQSREWEPVDEPNKWIPCPPVAMHPEEKQPSPKESGRYMISNDDHPLQRDNCQIWSPALYDAVTDKWTQYSIFHSSPDGFYEIGKPDRWQTVDQTIKDLGYGE